MIIPFNFFSNSLPQEVKDYVTEQKVALQSKVIGSGKIFEHMAGSEPNKTAAVSPTTGEEYVKLT